MKSELISIQTADYLPDYKLHIHFNDGADKTVDFKPFLTQSQHPSIRAFLQPEKFQGFRVEHGDLVWGDYDLCFPVADFTKGGFEAEFKIPLHLKGWREATG